MEAARLTAVIDSETAKGEAGMKRFGGLVDEAHGHVKNFLGSVAGIAGGMAVFSAVAGGAALVTSQLTDMVKSGMDANAVAAQTAAVLKSTHGAAGVTADSVEKLSTQLMNLTGIDDDTVTSTQNMLLTFTNIGAKGGVFDQATKTALDMSVALGQDTKSSAIQLGKALNDPVKGITALQRVGVTFDETQKKQIANFMKAGDVAGAQGVILKELNKEFGGSAEAAGKANGGIKILTAQFDNMKQSVGQALIPIIADLTGKFAPLVGQLANALPGAIAKAQAFIAAMMPTVRTIAATVMTQFVPALQRLWVQVGPILIPALQQLGTLISTHIGPAMLLIVNVASRVVDAFTGIIVFVKQTAAQFALAPAVISAALAQVQADVAAVVAGVQGMLAAVVRFWNDWQGLILGVAGVLTAIFGPALINSGVQATVAGAKIAASFIAATVDAGIKAGLAAAQGMADFIIGLIRTGAEAIATGVSLVTRLVPAILTMATQFAVAAAGGIASAITGLIAYASAGYAAAIATFAAAAPIVLIVAGLALLTAGIVLLVTHWQELSDNFAKSDFGQGFIGFINTVIDGINAFIDLINHIPGVNIPEITHVGVSTGGGVDKGSGGSATVNAGGGNRFASGGVTPGGPVLVGERGPELIAPPRGSHVFTADETRKMLQGAGKGGGHSTTVNIYPQKADLNAADLSRHLRRVALHASTGGAY